MSAIIQGSGLEGFNKECVAGYSDIVSYKMKNFQCSLGFNHYNELLLCKLMSTILYACVRTSHI